jgi:hypothetical protein
MARVAALGKVAELIGEQLLARPKQRVASVIGHCLMEDVHRKPTTSNQWTIRSSREPITWTSAMTDLGHSASVD